MSPQQAVYRRDHETAKVSSGVRVNPTHWASISVHAFHRSTGEKTLVTWCGIEVDLSAGGAHTTDIITCLACGEASLKAFWGTS